MRSLVFLGRVGAVALRAMACSGVLIAGSACEPMASSIVWLASDEEEVASRPPEPRTVVDDGTGSPACDVPLSQCGNGCSDTQVDEQNCGGCGVACSDGEQCLQGHCASACVEGTQRCGMVCVDSASDREHCGGCGVPCADDASCDDGYCRSADFFVTSITPDHGYYPGGRRVSIEGGGFDASTTVKLGAAPCERVALRSASRLTCVVGSGVEGSSDVWLTNADNDTALLPAGFHYDGFTQVDVVAGSGVLGGDDGPGHVASFSESVNGLLIDGDTLYLTDGGNRMVRRLELGALEPDDVIAAGVQVSWLSGSGATGTAPGDASTSAFMQPDDPGAIFDGKLLVTDTQWGASAPFSLLRSVDLASGETEHVLFGVQGQHAFGGVAVSGSFAYLGDCYAESIKRIDLTSGAWVDFVGAGASGAADGVGTAARFNCPYGLALDPSGSDLYVADWYNHSIRHVDVATASVTTLAGGFDLPGKLALAGRYLFVSDHGNCTVQQLDLSSGTVSLVAGSPKSCSSKVGPIAGTSFERPLGIAYHPHFGLFVSSSEVEFGYGASRQIWLIH
jgi:hypothetical protein